MSKSSLPFNKKNYRLMLIGLLVLIVGFITMSLDTDDYGFGFMGTYPGSDYSNDRIRNTIFCHPA